MKILDTNICHTYAIDFLAKGAGCLVRVQRHNRDAVAAAVDGAAKSGVLAMPDIVAVEMRSTVPWAVKSATKAAGALSVSLDINVDGTLAKFVSSYDRFGIHNDTRYVERIDGMYAEYDAMGG